MLTEKTGQLIVVLLAAILAVLVFGREAIGPWLFWGGATFVVLAILFYVIREIWRVIVSDIAQYAAEERREGGSGILIVIAWVGIIGNGIVVVWALLMSFQGTPYGDALQLIPYYWVPLVLLFVGYGGNEGVKWLREKREERRIKRMKDKL